MRVRAGLAAARGARRGPTARCSGALLGAALWFAPGLIAVPAAGPLASSGPGPERIGALRIQSESPPAEAGSAPPAPPVEASRLRDLGGAAPADGGALEVEAGQPFEWVIEVLHPAGFAPEFQPAQADAPGGPLDPERGWALIENRPFAPVEAPAPGIYRSRAVLTVAALAGGSRSTEAGLERVPERRLPDLAIGFVDSAQPSAARGPGTGSPPDFSAAAPAVPASPPGPRSVPGPRLAVRSLIAAGQSAPLPPLPAPGAARG